MKKLNAKRFTTEIGYEFLDGRDITITIQTLSTKEMEELGALSKKGGITPIKVNDKTARLLLAKNEGLVVDSVLKEQYESGVLLNFTNALFECIDEAKKEQGNG